MEAPHFMSIARRRQRMDELSRGAERIVNLILHTDLPRVDVDIQIEKLRWQCEDLFPGRDWLFDMIYVSRFERIWQQFRIPQQCTLF